MERALRTSRRSSGGEEAMVDVEVGGEEVPLLQGGSATAEHRNNSRRTDASLLVSRSELAGLSNQSQ